MTETATAVATIEQAEPADRPLDPLEIAEHRLGGLWGVVRSVVESWGDTIDPREWQYDDDFGFGRTGRQVFYTTRNDRSDGKFLPVYQSEMDLAAIRAESRNATASSTCVQGAFDALANYTLGPGFTFTIQPRKDAPPVAPEALVACVHSCQKIIDKFLADNWFTAGQDREIHYRSREDGEAFIWLRTSPSGAIKTTLLEADEVCQPANARQIEDWLTADCLCDCDAFVSSWSFGVHTANDWPEEALGFHVVRDQAGSDWDYIPESRCLQIKRNVISRAKRGVADLYWVANDVQREAKLTKNVAEGAALQAAIAWVRQFPKGTTPTGVQSLNSSQQIDTRNQITSTGTRAVKQVRYKSGSVLNVPEGQEYKPGPMGAERNPNFLLVAAHVLRRMAQRWSMPEYLISSDASNANYASTLVSEAPFVKAREADQRFYGEHFRRMVERVLRLAWEIGRLCPGMFRCFDEMLALIEVKVGYPAVATRDPAQLQTVQQGQIQMGILSKQTACEEAGKDWDQEQQRIAEESATPTAPGADPAAAGDAGSTVQDTALNGAQVQSLQGIITAVAAKSMPVESARGMISAAFPMLSAGIVNQILEPLINFVPPVLPDGSPNPAAAAQGTDATGQPASAASAPGSGVLLGQNRSAQKNAIKLIADIQNQVIAGTMTPADAVRNLGLLGVSQADAQGYVTDAADGKVDNPPTEEQQPITEAVEELIVVAKKNASGDFPTGIPTKEGLLEEVSRQLDDIESDLTNALLRGDEKKALAALGRKQRLLAEAEIAAEYVGRMTPFKPTIQDAPSAEDASVTPLAAKTEEAPADDAKGE